MKLLISLFIFTSFTSLAQSQDSIQFVFNKRVDLNNGYHDGGGQALYWNHGILNLGYCYDSTGKAGMTLSYLDTLGNIIWNRNYFCPLNDTTPLYGFDIQEVTDSLFYVVGAINPGSTADTDYDLFLAKFDQQGDSLFFHFFPSAGMTYPIDFLKNTSGDIFILSKKGIDVNDLNNTLCVYRVNAGETLDTLLEYSASLKVPYQLFEHDHRYYIGGTKRTSSSSNYHLKVFIDVFDIDFNFLTTWDPSTTLNEEFLGIFSWRDKLHISAYVTAYDPSNTNPFYQNKIACIETGNYSNSVSFGTLSFIHYFGEPVVINDSLLVVTHGNGGVHSLYFVDSNLHVRRFASGYPPYGTLLFYNYFDTRCTAKPGGQLIGTGNFSWNPGEYNDHWFYLTTDLRSYLPESTAGYHQLQNEELGVYPVPFSSELTIIRTENTPAIVQIMNLSGQCILTQLIDGRAARIATDELPVGTYLFRLIENGITKEVKVLKE